MLIKIVKDNGDIRYIKMNNDIVITQDMFKEGEIYLINDKGETIEKVYNPHPLSVELEINYDNLHLDDNHNLYTDEYITELGAYDGDDIIRYGLNMYETYKNDINNRFDKEEILDVLKNCGLTFIITRK